MFKKGQSGNPGGRPPGAKDKATKGIRDKISDILTVHFTPEKVAENLEAMESKDRLIFLTKLLDYMTPKFKQTELTTDKINGSFVVKVGYGRNENT